MSGDLDLRHYDVAVVGTGPAALMAVEVFRRGGLSVVVLDSSVDPVGKKEELSVLKRRVDQSEAFRYRMGVHPPLKTVFGSTFAHDVPVGLHTRYLNGAGGNPSFAFAGHSNVWGANLMKYSHVDMQGWPETHRQLDQWYEFALKFLPKSSPCPSELVAVTADMEKIGGLTGDPRVTHLYGRNKRLSVEIEPSVLAIQEPGRPRGCTACNECLSGCPEDAIYSTRRQFANLEAEGLQIYRRVIVTRLKHFPSHVECSIIDAHEKSRRVITKRVVLAAGPMSSTALVLSASKSLAQAELRDSQAVTIPMLAIRSSRQVAGISLNQANLEVRDESSGKTLAHFQIYGRSGELDDAVEYEVVRRHLPRRFARTLQKHSLAVHGFLSSNLSSKINVRYREPRNSSFATFEYSATPPSDRKEVSPILATARRHLLTRGFLLLVGRAHWESAGRSYHLASSFPVGAAGNEQGADSYGRPVDLERIHIVDAASLPIGPPASPTLTVMAHASLLADRITNLIRAENA